MYSFSFSAELSAGFVSTRMESVQIPKDENLFLREHLLTNLYLPKETITKISDNEDCISRKGFFFAVHFQLENNSHNKLYKNLVYLIWMDSLVHGRT